MGKDLSIYGHSNIFDHELLLLTILYMINKLGGETLSPYLSLCSMDAICSKNMLWVVQIMEDYMIFEYVGFAKSKLLHRPFLKIRWIAIIWWLKILFVSFKKVYDLYFNMWIVCYLIMRSFMSWATVMIYNDARKGDWNYHWSNLCTC